MKKIQTRPLALHVRAALIASATALMTGGIAFAADAQDAKSDAQEQPAPAQDPAAAQSAADDAAMQQLGNITVTAQSRTQQVQEVPIAMQVVTAAQIDKLAATDLSKMDMYIPGLSVDGNQATQPFFGLRGISQSDFGIGTDSPVGVYENGVYMGKTGGALLMFNDIERVEVLKGPQGTLFGRNSAAGAISVATIAPGSEFEAQARTRLGNHGQRYLDGVLNLPVTQDVAARFSFVDIQSDGWLRDAASRERYKKENDWGLRAQLQWNAPGDTVVNFAWEHERLKQPSRPAIGVTRLPDWPELPPTTPDVTTYLDPRDAPVFNDTIDNRESRTYDSFTLRVEHPLPFGDLTSLTSFQRYHTFNRADQDGTNRLYLYLDDVNIERHKTWSQEFKLAGKTDLADWVGGISWYKDDGRQTSQINLFTDSIDTLLGNLGIAPGGLYGPLTQGLQAAGFQYSLLGDPWQENMNNRGVAKAAAIYGDVIWHLTDRLNLTTGVRFTRDERDFSWYTPPRIADQLDLTLLSLQSLGLLDALGVPIETFQQNIYFVTPSTLHHPVSLNRSWTDTSPRVVLDYKLTPDVMLYASATKGYQAGGFNALEVASVYRPQTVRNYEAGIKSWFPDYKLLFNASVYYYKYSNLPNLTLVSNGGGSGEDLPQYQIIPSDQEAKGLEFEARWQATESLRLTAAAAYINQTYKKYTTSDGRDLSGQATGLPLWSGMLGIDYVLHDVVHGDLAFTLQGAFTGKARCNDDSALQGSCIRGLPFKTGDRQTRADFRVGWSSPNVPWSFAVFVNNVFDKRYVTGLNNISTSVLGTTSAGITPPRLWGVEAAVKF
ncbi:TonB-dependent receptor [Dokdonella ginsengisoli]|uniref:TonB-dependent receptor n=1 Tax=Dokdonella ginsengisoli TaxID=363846 RepID=A0ABV9QXE6_9GAMM